MQLAMIGSGYVGLVSGACFADFGFSVTCIDADAGKIARLNQGDIPIYEPGLDDLVRRNVAAGRLAFTTDLAAGVAAADIVFIAVGTPRAGDGDADLSHVEAATRQIAAALDGFTIIATKSTVPVGTGDRLEALIREVNPAADFALVSNPEFLREGAAIADFKIPDRIIVGLEDERARAPMVALYRPLYLNTAPLVFTSRRSAELAKYAANAFLAIKISFINEIADLCEATGANVQDVSRSIGLDKRIGSKFLHAGPGYGGSCFPKDTVALAAIGRRHNAPQRLVDTTIAVNAGRAGAMARKIAAAVGGDVAGKAFAVLGLTFKPETDDMRDAPSLGIITTLQKSGATIRAYDPEGMKAAAPLLPGVAFATGPYDAASGADALVIITEWNAFRSLDLSKLKSVMRKPVLVDLRNIYRRQEVEAAGFAYVSVGQPAPSVLSESRTAAE
ncbi:MAG: UDP-glucose/GDP-mannose dehydrogenase family protein [Devosia sp.]